MKIINFLKSAFSSNKGWKLASIGIAVLLWFIVMNTLNPTETKSYVVPLSLLNEEILADNGYAILNKEELAEIKIEVKIKATRPALDELTKQKELGVLKAAVDLQQVDTSKIVNPPQNLSINISPIISNVFIYSYEVVSCTPSNVNIYFDNVKEKEIHLTTNFTGELEEGFIAEVEKLSVNTVKVFGPASEFDKVGSVIAAIDLEGKTSDFQTTLEPVVFNTNGEAMPNFIVKPKGINADVSIKYGKKLEILKPETKGTISDDLVLKNIDWSPKVIELTGDKEVLDTLSPVKLPPIELDKLVGSDIRTYEVAQYINDERVTAKSNAPRVITVTIEVAGMDGKNVTFNANEINVTGLAPGFKAQLPSQIVLTIFGEQAALDKVTNQSLAPTVDLNGLKEGATEVPLKVALPSGVETRGETKLYVFITKQEETSAETSTEATTAEISTEISTATETTTKAIEKPVAEDVAEETTSEVENKEE